MPYWYKKKKQREKNITLFLIYINIIEFIKPGFPKLGFIEKLLWFCELIKI